jgi:hypothetical protein
MIGQRAELPRRMHHHPRSGRAEYHRPQDEPENLARPHLRSHKDRVTRLRVPRDFF